jgi:hypothetical protein
MQEPKTNPYDAGHLSTYVRATHLYIHRSPDATIINHPFATFLLKESLNWEACTPLRDLTPPQPGNYYFHEVEGVQLRPQHQDYASRWQQALGLPTMGVLSLTNEIERPARGLAYRVLLDVTQEKRWLSKDLTDCFTTSLRALRAQYRFEEVQGGGDPLVKVMCHDLGPIEKWETIAFFAQRFPGRTDALFSLDELARVMGAAVRARTNEVDKRSTSS